MIDAVRYRKGIGDDAQAIADTKYFIETFGHEESAEAANASFSLTVDLREAGRRRQARRQAPARVHREYGDERRRRPAVIA